jgi:hypothetical protein
MFLVDQLLFVATNSKRKVVAGNRDYDDVCQSVTLVTYEDIHT